MKRYYFVRYMYKAINGLSISLDNTTFLTTFNGINIKDTEERIKKDANLGNVTILNFKELTEEEYKINLNKEEDK